MGQPLPLAPLPADLEHDEAHGTIHGLLSTAANTGTFAARPPAGAEISGMVYRCTDASHLNELYFCTGAEWLQIAVFPLKIKGPFYDVRAYNPPADGIGDDTPAFTAASNDACAGDRHGTVLVPAQVESGAPTFGWRVVGWDLTNKPCRVKGEGSHRMAAIFLHSDTDNIVNINNVVDVDGYHFENLGFSCNHSVLHDNISMNNVAGFHLFHCSFGAARYGAFLNANCRLGVVDGCWFGSFNERGLMLGSSSDSNSITNNWFDENQKNTGYGLAAGGGGSGSGLHINGSFNTVTGNRFMDNTTYHIFIDLAGAANNFTGNTFRSAGSAGFDGATWIRYYGNDNCFWGNICQPGPGAANQHLIVSAGALRNITGPNHVVGVSGAGSFAAYYLDGSGNGTNKLVDAA